MATVTISSKYQIVIPKEVREVLDIKPGQGLRFITEGGTARFVVVRGIDDLMGIANGANVSGLREKTDRI